MARLQMGLRRLLQRGFASLFGYKESLPLSEIDDSAVSEYSSAILVADSMKELHFKMKGARFLPTQRVMKYFFKATNWCKIEMPREHFVCL